MTLAKQTAQIGKKTQSPKHSLQCIVLNEIESKSKI